MDHCKCSLLPRKSIPVPFDLRITINYVATNHIWCCRVRRGVTNPISCHKIRVCNSISVVFQCPAVNPFPDLSVTGLFLLLFFFSFIILRVVTASAKPSQVLHNLCRKTWSQVLISSIRRFLVFANVRYWELRKFLMKLLVNQMLWRWSSLKVHLVIPNDDMDDVVDYLWFMYRLCTD